MSAYLIRGARLATGEVTDLLLRDGVVAETGRGLSGGEVVDADGLLALPGLVDLHTHLRQPGREDAETVESGSRAAALGGYTAVCAMANTDPVADTAGVVEQVYRLGREAGLVDVQPIGAVTVGLTGERLAELGAMADSAARVRVFSDDGHCVSDPALMRRALEYVKAFGGVIAQHAEEPRLTAGAQMNEGDVSARLASPAGPRRRRSRSSPATRFSPGTSAPGCTSATSPRRAASRSSAGRRRRASASPPRSPHTTCCSPTSSRPRTTRCTR